MNDVFEIMMELRCVTERFPTGEIKESVPFDEIWVPFSERHQQSVHGYGPEYIIAPLSTTRVSELMREGKQTMRRIGGHDDTGR